MVFVGFVANMWAKLELHHFMSRILWELHLNIADTRGVFSINVHRWVDVGMPSYGDICERVQISVITSASSVSQVTPCPCIKILMKVSP
jgi:hypothetical protein